jgi:hypothetical protein
MKLDPVRLRILALMKRRQPPTDLKNTSLAIAAMAPPVHRTRSARPNPRKVGTIAAVLKVERTWLLRGMGEGEAPVVDKHDD